MRQWSLVLLTLLAACAGPATVVKTEDGVNFAQYRHIGVMPLVDPRGQGSVIAEKIEAGLERLGYPSVDQKALQQVLAQHKPDKEFGLDLEAMEAIRKETSADAVVFGRVAPDWSSVSFVMVEAQMGDTIASAMLRPQDRRKMAFATADEIAVEALRVLTRLR